MTHVLGFDVPAAEWMCIWGVGFDVGPWSLVVSGSSGVSCSMDCYLRNLKQHLFGKVWIEMTSNRNIIGLGHLIPGSIYRSQIYTFIIHPVSTSEVMIIF